MSDCGTLGRIPKYKFDRYGPHRRESELFAAASNANTAGTALSAERSQVERIRSFFQLQYSGEAERVHSMIYPHALAEMLWQRMAVSGKVVVGDADVFTAAIEAATR